MNNEFITKFKEKANNKNITTEDIIAYFILKSMKICQKSNNVTPSDLTNYFLSKAFTKSSENGFDVVKRSISSLRWDINRGNKIFDEDVSVYLNEEEKKEFLNILSSIEPNNLDKHYSFIFVRKDLDKTYQIVQASHAAMVAGSKIKSQRINVDKIHFVLIGVENLSELNEVDKKLSSLRIKFVTFNEEDIGNEDTAICTLPIFNSLKSCLSDYQTLE